jgi:hypothetical protein
MLLEDSYIARTTKKSAFGLQFLCCAYYIAASWSAEPCVIEHCRQSALEHFKKVQVKKYKEETNNGLDCNSDHCHAMEVLQTNDLEQQEVHNYLTKATSPNFLFIDICIYIIVLPATVVII